MNPIPSIPFQVYAGRVVQGEFMAEALSPTKLRSNFRSPYENGFSRVVFLKFSINGRDNELPFAVNHTLVIRPDESGTYISPLYVFGQKDERSSELPPFGDFLEPNTEVKIRLDMRSFFRELEEEGHAVLANGQRIQRQEINGIFVAGSSKPLTWNWTELPARSDLQLSDPSGDGIFEVTLLFNPRNPTEEPEKDSFTSWELSHDLSRFPSFSSDQVLVDALYNLSLEELLLDFRKDSTFQAGKKWPGVWTRDISYSILLSLAFLDPEGSKRSLMHKVKNGRIVQDTGTGGSWPVSTDRTVWILAAWEVYKATGDKNWLETIFPIIERSIAADLVVAYNPSNGLFYGESSFLDWREQSYPDWMSPADIYNSHALGTNAVMAEAYRILAEMEDILEGEDTGEYALMAQTLGEQINNRFWVPERGYYGQFLYPQGSLSPRAEALGEALCVLFDIAPPGRRDAVVRHTPVTPFGIPCIYPQIPGVPPYHNDAVWPFVQAFWNWAAAKQKNEAAVKHGLDALYRPSALFLTNKENFVAGKGDFLGTETNSDRQLWSVAGNLAMVYRVFLGMSLEADRLCFSPLVPEAYGGKKVVENLRYRDATLTVELTGYGDTWTSATLDGVPLEALEIPGNLNGDHVLKIALQPQRQQEAAHFTLLPNRYSLSTPVQSPRANVLHWAEQEGANVYEVFRDGIKIGETEGSQFSLESNPPGACYQVQARDELGYASFLSAPVCNFPESSTLILEPEVDPDELEDRYPGYFGAGYLKLSLHQHTEVRFSVTVLESGTYRFDLHYANGNGPVSTDNKCAIRSLFVENNFRGSFVMPQLGAGKWDVWAYSNPILVPLEKGTYTLRLRFMPSDHNMNGTTNEALVDHLRMVRVGKNDE